MKTTEYIDALRVKLNARSDYHLAQMLVMQQNQLARYRKGGTFDNNMAARVAKILELPPFAIIADMELERAKDDKAREMWQEIRGFILCKIAPRVYAASSATA
jgi:hypothetical protein